MPLIFGPKNSRYAYTGSPCPHTDLAFESNAETLGDAIKAYEARFDVSISPYSTQITPDDEDAAKYFLCKDNQAELTSLVDIHIFRGKEEICPKQNISFKLELTDMVELGEPIC